MAKAMERVKAGTDSATLISTSTISLVGIVVVSILVGILSNAIIQRNRDSLASAYNTRFDLQRVLTLVVDRETGVRGFTSTREPLFLAPYERTGVEVKRTLDKLRRGARNSALSPIFPLIDDIDRTHARWTKAVAHPLIARPSLAASARLQFEGKTEIDRIRDEVARAQLIVDGVLERERVVTRLTIAAAIAVIIVFAVVLGVIGLQSERRRFNQERKLRAEIAARNLALERSNASLSEFAYVASHDLQEPLRTVASFTQLLQRRYADKLDDTANEFIDFAVDGAGRMQQLISDILQYSRVTTHGKELRAVDLGLCVRRAVGNLRIAIAERNASVDVGAMPEVLGDDVQLVQLMQNLIGNGLKYSHAVRPHVSVRAARGGEWWTISVEDNGIGIAPVYHERIFRIFARLHTRDEYSGTGIGLAVVNGIVDRHHGQIWVDSEEGNGATFYFTLKAVPRDREAQL
ncbi:MAG: sensor histidine kinase [Vulcanimicrobiaceae bacterium]